MTEEEIDEAEEARLLLEHKRRRLARKSLVEYARFIEIPGVPLAPSQDDWSTGPCTCRTDEERSQGACASCRAWDDLRKPLSFKPIESAIVLHHRIILESVQVCMETPRGRLMIIAPPGSAKSTYADVVGPSWAMGRWPGYQIILSTYASSLARKQARKTLQVVRSRRYRSLWKERPEVRRDVAAAHEWALTNGSTMLAAGILAGITGNRAHGAIGDDLIAGREEAESPTMREKIMEAYRDDLESRLLPNGWMILINTRWHMEDPCGSILPEDYAGQSGYIKCRDGLVWYVLNIPAKAENADDPLGRKVGEYLWQEWFPKEHWQVFENNPLGRRRWASLYQGRPTSDAGDDFKREDAQWYKRDALPKRLQLYGASDYAVKEQDPEDQKIGKVDRVEHGLVGMDEDGDLWFLDWSTLQGKGTDESLSAWIKLLRRARAIQKTGAIKWWDEGGTIDKAIRPAARRAMREARTYVVLDALPSIADKRAKCQSFAARYSARTCHFPLNDDGTPVEWAEDGIAQLCGFPGHRYDDKYDVFGLIGRGIDKMLEAPQEPEKAKAGPLPFTEKWLMSNDTPERPKVRYK